MVMLLSKSLPSMAGIASQNLFTVSGAAGVFLYAHISTAMTRAPATGDVTIGIDGAAGLLQYGLFYDDAGHPPIANRVADMYTVRPPNTSDSLINNAPVFISNQTIKLFVTATITAGAMIVYVQWYPLSVGATVTVV